MADLSCKIIQGRASIIPILAKADTMTEAELKTFRALVVKQLADVGFTLSSYGSYSFLAGQDSVLQGTIRNHFISSCACCQQRKQAECLCYIRAYLTICPPPEVSARMVANIRGE